jgi:hypothetical protein
VWVQYGPVTWGLRKEVISVGFNDAEVGLIQYLILRVTRPEVD